MRLRRAIELCLLLGAGLAPAVERTVCVPGEDRRWVCGDAAAVQSRPVVTPTPPPAAPLPPVLLIDPDRLFGPAPKRESAGAGTTSAPEQGSEPAARTAVTTPARPDPAPALATLPRRGSHVWQLVRASSPAGFAAFVRGRGLDPADTRAVRTRRGDWLLLYGDFAGIEAARTAKARAGAGFARAWSDIESEL